MAQPGFSLPIQVRFKHCDPAGIAFYPRLFEFANDTVEAWFSHIGFGFPDLIGRRGLGAPTVAIQARFERPCRYGETLQAHLTLTALGRSSAGVEIVLAGPEGETRAVFTLTLVCVDRDPVKAHAWPEDVRAAMAAALI